MQAIRRSITLLRRTHPPSTFRQRSSNRQTISSHQPDAKAPPPRLRHVPISTPCSSSLKSETQNSSLNLQNNVRSLSIGFSSGTLGAMCGIGGAVFSIPALLRFTTLSSQQIAAGNSLIAVTAVATTGAASFYFSSAVDVSIATPLAISAALFAPIGARAAKAVDSSYLRRTLGFFMLCLAPALPIRDSLDRNRGETNSNLGTISPSSSQDHDERNESPSMFPPLRTIMLAICGSGIGLFSGLLGISGGSFFTPLIAVTCPEMPFHTVMGTSFLAMIFPTAAGAASYAKMNLIAPAFLPTLIIGAMVGARLGTHIALEANEDFLHKVFAVIFAVMGFRTMKAPISKSAQSISGAVTGSTR